MAGAQEVNGDLGKSGEADEDKEPGVDIYEDEDDSGCEDGRQSMAMAGASGEGRGERSSSTPILRSGGSGRRQLERQKGKVAATV